MTNATVFSFKGLPEQASHRRVVVYHENERLNPIEAFLLSLRQTRHRGSEATDLNSWLQELSNANSVC